MKILKLLIFFTFVVLFFNTQGQNKYIGRITVHPDPCQISNTSAFNASKYGLGTFSGDNFILTLDSNYIFVWEQLIIGNNEYFLDDIVIITGTTRLIQGNNVALSEYKELVIQTIDKWEPPIQDNQHFLGSYILECDESDFLNFNSVIVLSEYFDNSLKLLFPYEHFISCYMINDSLFVPFQWLYYGYNNNYWSFSGSGEIKNDSIFLNYSFGTHVQSAAVGPDRASYFTSCNCKGKKIGTHFDVTLIANPTAGGTVIGGGTNIAAGTYMNIKAIPDTADNYTFVNWTNSDGEFVSIRTHLPFFVYKTVTLTANFAKNVGITDINSDNIIINPNPASETVIIEYHQFRGVEEVRIFDITGKSLFEDKLSGVISNIDISSFSSGIYFIKVITQEQVHVQKLIKK
jgi:hypothetical protein